jgi:hypothetical protein
MKDSADHYTPKTGLTPTVTISKNGAAFGAPAGAVTELSGGVYQVAGNATDTNTLGILWLHATSAGADAIDTQYDIVGFDPTNAIVPLNITPSTLLPGANFKNIEANATTNVLTSRGILSRVVINTAGAAGNTCTLYDDPATTNNKLATIDTTTGVGVLIYNIALANGLTVVTATGTAAKLTIITQ